MKFNRIKIDKDKCNGCGICIAVCHRGVLEIVDGKSSVKEQISCDGLEDCINVCPQDAISMENLEVEGKVFGLPCAWRSTSTLKTTLV